MIGLQARRLPCSVLAWVLLFLGSIVSWAHAQEAGTQKPEPAPSAQEPNTPTKPKEAPANGAAASGAPGSTPKFDPAVVSAGQAAFERDCTKCHDAARSLERTKDIAGWRATVTRMAAKRGADVPSSDIEPIAVYLTSRNTPAATGAPSEGGAAAPTVPAAASAASAEMSSLSAFATLSPQWRGGNDHLQNPGFGPLAWVGASWQGKIVSVRATLCVTCHGVQEPGLISRVEPVEAAVHVELTEYLQCFCKGIKGGIDAGRFVVPFGAFSAQVDPSLYRTVSTPLIFNMGQRIFNQDLSFPVLPMPYADKGINFNLAVPLGDCGTGPISATMDTYLVNGLIGSGNGVDFLQSRDLFDNNDRVAGGARVTVGDPYIRTGASVTTGRFDDPNAAVAPTGLYYTIFGYDVQAHYKRLFRFQAEFARRESDRFGILANGAAIFTEAIYGYYLEAEARPWEKCRVSFLTRYDSQRHNSPLPPSGSSLPTGNFNVERVTLGINIELWHQSLLMFNYERWLLPEPAHPRADIFGVRYTVTF
ncbi:MAG TPA: hypothetical protein VKU02_10265 [Gemmataceae bacterium]|nr:hypothetical protein [Gemmataceae bacterium]